VVDAPAPAVSQADIRCARQRIDGAVRRTPIMRAPPVRHPTPGQGDLWLKLESLQIAGSFKARGAVNRLRQLAPADLARGLVTASGGNHGLGVAYAGWLASVPTTIVLPSSTPLEKHTGLRGWGADILVHGSVWDEANQAALAIADRPDGPVYIHAFADPDVIAGQGTIGLEILEDLPDVDELIVAIGGGGLISGISVAAKSIRPSVRIVGVEPVGAPTLYESLRAGHLVELPEITTTAGTLAPRLSVPITFDIIQRLVDEIVLVSDDDMRQAARWLWDELHLAVELSGAAAVAAVLKARAGQRPGRVCALVCGAGTDGLVTPDRVA
jgi:threonine dehydratase